MKRRKVFTSSTRRRTNRTRKVRKEDAQSYASGQIARPLPAKFRTRLTYQNGETLGVSTKVVRGLSEFLAKPPMYYNYFFGIYKYARVLAVELEIAAVSSGTDAIRLAAGRLPFSDTSGITFSQFCELPDVRQTVISGKGGMDRWSFRKLFVAKDANGNVLTDHSYWVNSAQAISTTPLHNDDYVLMLMSDGPTVNVEAKVNVRLHYHIEWFDMQYAV